MNIYKIFLSLAIVFIMAISSAIFTILKMNDLTTNTTRMYSHPFKVTNAISDIQISTMTIHRNMKDIVLIADNNSQEIIKIIESIQYQEDNVYKNFHTIYNKYLGKKEDIDTVYKTFKAWKAIREEVITLVYSQKLPEAILITKDKGAKHIDKLYTQISVLKNYAFDKANELYNLSIKNSGIDEVIFIFLLTLIISTFIVLFVIKNLLKISQANDKQLYLIDQNILTATLSLDREVIYISNALCYALDKKINDILNTKERYFFTTQEQFKQFESKIYSGKEHSEEIYIEINNEKSWFVLEILPELNQNFQIISFNIFLTNINDKKKIEEVSITDTLTGLYNRNYFEMIFTKEVKRAKRAKKPLSIMMLDIDYFKQYNDTYGHQDGDIALKAVSHILSAHTNCSYDYAFRVGGEEFVIISYQKDFEMLEMFAKTILQEIEALKISHKNSKISKFLTLSAGVIQFGQEHLLSTDDMYKLVDKLLYQAKKDGRNTFKSLYIN